MTYRLPTLNGLRAFEAAARHSSFKAAALELGVTAGAISQQVKKLESSLDVALFRRLPHGLLLTQEGERYFARVSRIFDDLTDATEEIAPKINAKKFRVGICPDVRIHLAERWPRHNEELISHVREIMETSDIQLIRNYEIDCLLRLSGGVYGDLFYKSIGIKGRTEVRSVEVDFICRSALADCRQTRAILDDLHMLEIS